jgi:SAM-dependent methyltransferase
MDDVESALGGVGGLYGSNVEKYGAGPEAVGWRDRETHELRFDKLAQALPGNGEPFTVNDHGCGYGALFEYLVERGFPVVGYLGTDISAEMLGVARARVADPRAEFVEAALPPADADYTFVSGTFNVRLGATEASWETYVKETLAALAARSRRGIAFNLLTTYVDWRDDNLFYADPKAFFDFCRSELSRYVVLLHDYPLYEWTMLVRFED